jgi:hypothetical protein
MTPEQKRNRSGFLDSNCDPCPPHYDHPELVSRRGHRRRASASFHFPVQCHAPGGDRAGDRIQQAENRRVLHGKVARLEVRLNHLSCERARRTLVLLAPSGSRRSVPAYARSGSRGTTFTTTGRCVCVCVCVVCVCVCARARARARSGSRGTTVGK